VGGTSGGAAYAGGAPVAGGGVGGNSNAGAAGTGGAPLTRTAAHGISLGLVQASQGVAVALRGSSGPLPVSARNARLVEGRSTLLRAFVQPDPGRSADPVIAVLTLSYADGTTQLKERQLTPLAASDAEILESTFNFLLAASEVKAGMHVSVALQQAESATAPPSPASSVTRFPEQGDVDLGIAAGPMEVTVVFVPAQTQGGAPMSTDERRQRIITRVMDLYPIQKMNVTWHAPQPLDNAADRTQAYAMLRDLCYRDHATPNVLYHLILRQTDSGFAFRGISVGQNRADLPCSAVGITVVADEPGSKVAYVDGVPGETSGNPDTTAHELAHNHNLRHIACGGPADPDPAFPYPNGFLGVQGYSLSEGALKSTKEYRDLMGYCSPRWVSDWTWNRLESEVRLRMAWDAVAMPRRVNDAVGPNAVPRTLSGYVDGQHASFALVPASNVDATGVLTATRYARVSSTSGDVLLPLRVAESADPDLAEVRVRLPTGPLPARVDVVFAGVSHTVDLAKIPSY